MSCGPGLRRRELLRVAGLRSVGQRLDPDELFDVCSPGIHGRRHFRKPVFSTDASAIVDRALEASGIAEVFARKVPEQAELLFGIADSLDTDLFRGPDPTPSAWYRRLDGRQNAAAVSGATPASR